MLKLMLRHRLKIVLALLVLAAGVVGVAVWGSPVDAEDLKNAREAVLHTLEDTHPVFVVAAIALLPLAGFPISALLLAAGAAYGKELGMLVGLVGVALNNTCGFFVAAWLRDPAQRWLEKRGRRVPEVSRGDHFKVVFLLRITPGLPATLQNYLLGLSGIPFWTFFWVSLIPQSIIVAGFILTGGALFEGNTGLIVLGVCLLVVFGIVGRLIHSHRKQKSSDDAAEA